jgi:predicted DNA-binding transcriptional regulator YafY
VRADRLVSLVLLLQARGRTPASVLAEQLEVSVRTIYRDLDALSTAGVPVVTESGPGGGCRLLDDYRFPLRGLRPDEAEALLVLGVPQALTDLGLDGALATARRRISVTAGLAPDRGALVHLDMPRWFGDTEPVPALRTLAHAVRLGRRLAFSYHDQERAADPLGLVNKAGTWYLVARTAGETVTVFRVSRLRTARLLAETSQRTADFDLAAFWAQWSADFAASLPRLAVTVRAAPAALAVFPEIFGDSVRAALAAAPAPGADGWRVVTLSFEHEVAAAHRLAGFGDLVEVLEPPRVRARLIEIGYAIIGRYR